MELVYLWVDKYKNIEKQGFNFSPRFECSFDEDNNELTIDKKEHIENFFGENINVTAIVGENGSGKSNIIELLYSGTSPSGSYFYIFDLGRELIIKGLEIDNQPNNIITNNEIDKKIFNDTKQIILDTKEIRGSLNLAQEQLSFVYFSTFLEWNEKIDIKCIIGNTNADKFDVSSAYLINYYSKHEYEMNNSSNNFIPYQNQYQLFKNKNIQNVINMLKNSDVTLPINTPEKLYISINHTLINNLDSNYEYFSMINTSELSFIHKIKLSFLINFLDYSVNNHSHETKLLNKLNIVNKSSIENIFEAFIKVFSIEHIQDDIQINSYIEHFNKMNNLLSFITNNQKKITYETLILNFNDIDNDFIENYQKLVLVGLDFFHFEWFPNLSTGQENLLFQFANFYTLKLDRFANDKLKNNVYIFIDEGENTLHPNWQKKYISYLIEFFDKNFTQKINFIFSSHSPFILSDLPKENVIFLDKYKKDEDKNQKEGNCKNVSKGININSFGANIHTLLSHGFFMKDGLMGEFAKGKITKILNFLNGKNRFIDMPINKIKPIIKIIGEDFLREKLLRMYDEKFKVKSKDEEIQELKAEIKRLKNAKN